MNLRVQQLLAEVDVLNDIVRTMGATKQMEAWFLEDDRASVAAFLTASAESMRNLAEVQNAIADRYAEAAQILSS